MALALSWIEPARAADTAGTVTLTVQLANAAGNYAPRHVVAVWVTNATLGYVKCLWKDGSGWTGEGTTHLDKLKAQRGSSTVLDGHSGATINTYNLFTVTWNCSNANNTALAPDGTYYFHVETTDRNSAGPYSGGLPMLKGPNPFSTNYPNQTYIKNLALNFTPAAPVHDIALAGLSPQVVAPNTSTDLRLVLTNKSSLTETNISVTLSNATASSLIGSQTLSSLAGGASVNLSFPWNTTGLATGTHSMVAWAGPQPGETFTSDNRLTNSVSIRALAHDVAVTSIGVPAEVAPEIRTNISVSVTNRGDYSESFTVTLQDLTDGRSIGTNRFTSLAPQGSASIALPWNTTNASWGNHTLRANAEIVAGETAVDNNGLSTNVLVIPQPQTVTYLTRSNLWRFNDAGTDLGSAWRQLGYSDSGWSLARGPFGFGDSGITTTVRSNMPGTTARIPTTYFRATFNATQPLPTNFVMNLRRDDGAVVYHNGVEVYRVYMTNDPVQFGHWANTAVGGTDELTYFAIPISTTNTIPGTNVVAVELHQNSSTSSDASFDLELIGTSPPFVPVHDVAVLGIIAPSQAVPGTLTNLQVLVTNLGSFAESVQVVVSDVTDATLIGSDVIPLLRTNSTASVTIPWTVPRVPYVQHILRAVALPVLSETQTANNTNAVTVLVSPIMEVATLLPKGAAWRYHDQGVDLTDTPWRNPDYDDHTWPLGAAPLGYGLEGLNTQISYGGDASHKHPTCYLRTEMFVDAMPVSLTLKARRDDGAIVYLNGQELARFNAPAGPIRFGDYFTGLTVSGADETSYFTTNLPAELLSLGRNVLAVEVHQDAPDSGDLAFDLELAGSTPVTTPSHDVAPLSVTALADGLVGDRLSISITVTNRGNVTETPRVLLMDAASGRVLGNRAIAPLVPGGSTTVLIDWPTLGADVGVHTVQAAIVMGGVTNVAQSVSAPVTLTGSGFGLRKASAAGNLPGRCNTLAIDGTRLVIGAGATLEVWDISNPQAPSRLGSTRLPGTIDMLVVDGSNAYAACGSAGVQFIDLGNPSAPAHVNTYDTSGNASGLALSGRYLYVADGGSGLRIVDISTPAHPVLAGAYHTPGPARAIRVVGSRAFLLDAKAGLLILDCSEPAQPRLLGSFAGMDAGRDLAISGTQVFMVDANNHFFAVDASDPPQPRLLNASNTALLPGLVAESMTIHGSTAYVSCGESGLAILNLSTPGAPVVEARFPTPGQAMQTAISGTALFLADGLNGLVVCDIAQPANPVLRSQLPISIRARDIAVQGQLAFVAAGEAGLRMFDVSKPSTPAWVGTYLGSRNARCVAVSGATAVVGDGQHGISILDVSTPSSPAPLGTWSSPDLASIRTLGMSGSKVVASDGWRVCLIDISIPEDPVQLSSREAPAFTFELKVAGSRAYLACGTAGFAIVDLQAANFPLLSLTPTDGLVGSISVEGNTAYIGNGSAGWATYDVSNPAAPSLLRSHDTPVPVSSVAVAGVFATLGGMHNAITFDVSQPLIPVPVQSFDTLVHALRLTASGDHVYAAEDDAGLAILDAVPTPFVIEVAAPSPGASGLTLRWASRPGKIYAIHRTSDLGLGRAGFVLVQGNISATAPLNTVTLDASSPAAFYIVSEQ